MTLPSVTFFTNTQVDEVVGEPPVPPIPPPQHNVGLGTGVGAGLVRSCLGATGVSVVDPRQRASRVTSLRLGRERKVSMMQPSPQPASNAQDMSPSLNDGPEPQGMFLGLLLNESGPAGPKDLAEVEEHRWAFKGASELAARGKSYCLFIRCLLDLQQNVQIDEEGDALEPNLMRACKSFVKAQCRIGHSGEMYHLLAHFISNSVLFDQWCKFLVTAFEDQRANQETFLVPHLEIVWSRFCKFRAVLESIFDVLNANYVWRHRLPNIGELVQDHMKRRCLSTDAVMRNELFTQGTQAARNETVKQVKFAIGLS